MKKLIMENITSNETYEIVFNGKDFNVSWYRVDEEALYIYHTMSNSYSVLIYCKGKDIEKIKPRLKQFYIDEIKSKIDYLQEKINRVEKNK